MLKDFLEWMVWQKFVLFLEKILQLYKSLSLKECQIKIKDIGIVFYNIFVILAILERFFLFIPQIISNKI